MNINNFDRIVKLMKQYDEKEILFATLVNELISLCRENRKQTIKDIFKELEDIGCGYSDDYNVSTKFMDVKNKYENY
jgi:hypothetical protein